MKQLLREHVRSFDIHHCFRIRRCFPALATANHSCSPSEHCAALAPPPIIPVCKGIEPLVVRSYRNLRAGLGGEGSPQLVCSTPFHADSKRQFMNTDLQKIQMKSDRFLQQYSFSETEGLVLSSRPCLCPFVNLVYTSSTTTALEVVA